MLKQASKIKIYTDGACSGNPGPGGYGSIIILDDNYVEELGDRSASTTNNRMELSAVIEALRKVKHLAKSVDQVDVYTDSVYVIKGITQWVFGWLKNNWKNAEDSEVVNQDLWKDLHQLVQLFPKKIKWSYVRGHNGDDGNERCDKIAVAFSKNDFVQLYSGDSKSYIFDVKKSPKVEPLPEGSWSKKDTSKKSWYISYVNGSMFKDDTWSACEARVKGRSGAKFKKVSSIEEEKEVLSKWGYNG